MAEAPSKSSGPRRIYVSHSPRDDPSALRSVRAALEEAGYVPLGEWSVPNIDNPQDFPHSLIATADGAVVLIGPAALQSASVASESIELLGRRTEKLLGEGRTDAPFPVIPLLSDLVSPAELRTGGLAELGDLTMAAASFPDRVTETIAVLDATFAGTPARTPLAGPVELSAVNVIDARTPVRSLALGEVAGRTIVVIGGLDGTVRMWDLGRPGAVTVLSGHEGSVLSVAVGTLGGSTSSSAAARTAPSGSGTR